MLNKIQTNNFLLEKIIEPYDMSGGNEMDNTNSSIWDSIQVDMSAEFDKVRLTLGELKNIEQGLVVDLCSVYDNKVSLKEKTLAK